MPLLFENSKGKGGSSGVQGEPSRNKKARGPASILTYQNRSGGRKPRLNKIEGASL